MSYREIKPEDTTLNPFSGIGSDWMLITAGDENGYNTMTAGWGGMGVLFSRNVVTVYIRPQRYTKKFVDENDTFTLSFYPSEYRQALTICGTKSGRSCDKVKEAGLTPLFIDGTTAFGEASLIFVCRKIYQDDLSSEHFLDKECDEKCYPEKDYHTMYIAEVEKVLVKE